MRYLRVLAWIACLAACERATPPPAHVAAVAQQPAVAVTPAPSPPPDAAAAPEPALPEWLPKPLPWHGFIIGVWGMAGSAVVVVDYDARTLRALRQSTSHDLSDRDRTRPITPAQVETLHALANAAEHEQPHGEEPHVTDVSQQFYVFDGDRHVEISGTVFDGQELDEQPWRPLAGQLLEAAFEQAHAVLMAP